MANEPFTPFSQLYNRNDLDRGSFTDCGDGTSSRQTVLCNVSELADAIAESLKGQGEELLLYSELSSLASNATGSIATYTVPTGKTLRLNRVSLSGCNMGDYSVKKDGNIIAKKRTYYTYFEGEVIFDASEFSAGENVIVEVLNRGLTAADFNVTIQGRLLDV